jgi:hypothetical protein
MKIKTFAELTTPDPFVLRLTRLGLSTIGVLSPEDAARFQQETIARADLYDDVPEGTRKSFERLRALHTYGILCYEAYTVAEDLAWLVLEQAVRERFIAFYDDSIPLSNGRDGSEHPIAAQHFDTVAEAFRSGGSHARGRWLLNLKAGGQMPFRATMGQLLQWARQEGLLAGQSNKRLDEVYVRMRNNVAHPHYHLTMPPYSALAIRDLAEIINMLWGHLTPGGRLYPAPLRREPMVVAWREPPSHELTVTRAEVLQSFAETGDWTCIVVQAVPDDDGLWEFDAQYERTTFPADLLWGPGSRDDALDWLADERPPSDTVPYLDRLFAVRTRGGRVSLPMTAEKTLALPKDEQLGDWMVVRADFPNHAFAHARHLKDGFCCGTKEPVTRQEPGRLVMTIPPIAACPVEEVAQGDWEEVSKELSARYHISAKPAIWAVRVPSRFGLAPDVEAPLDRSP